MRDWLLARAEAALNRLVAESSAAADRIATLEGRSLAIRVEGLGIGVMLRVAGGRVLVSDALERPADAVVSGTPLDLLRLPGPDLASRLPGSAARLTGQVHVAEQFADALRLAQPDFEEELAHWIGDVAAHRIGGFGRAGLRWVGRAAGALRLDVTEFLQEESRALPAAPEVAAFAADVERLRDDVERAAARLERIAARVPAAASYGAPR